MVMNSDSHVTTVKHKSIKGPLGPRGIEIFKHSKDEFYNNLQMCQKRENSS